MAEGGGLSGPPDPGKMDALNTEEEAKNAPKSNNARESFLYTIQDEAPYRVIVECLNEAKINKFSLGSDIRKMEKYRNHVIELKYLGRNKIIVFMNSYIKANLFVGDKKLEERGYKAYIPRHLCCVTGVLAGIPTNIDVHEIKAEVECEYQVVDVYRLNRFRNGIKEPTTRVSITFRANQLPEMVKLFCCTNKVRPFIQRVLFCEKCHRFNHKTENCKGKQRCVRCSQIHDEKDEICTNPVKCLYCKSSDHKTTDVTCPEREKQKTIKTIMAKRSLTFVEARELVVPVLTSNMYEALVESATDPTPAESFAFMTGRKHVKKSNQSTGAIPKRKIEIRERSGNGRGQAEQSCSRRDMELTTEKRSKTDESTKRQDQVEMDNTHTNGFSNPHKVSEAEQWNTTMAVKAATDTMNRNTQGSLMGFYSDIIQESDISSWTGKQKQIMKGVLKKHFKLDNIIF